MHSLITKANIFVFNILMKLFNGAVIVSFVCFLQEDNLEVHCAAIINEWNKFRDNRDNQKSKSGKCSLFLLSFHHKAKTWIAVHHHPS